MPDNFVENPTVDPDMRPPRGLWRIGTVGWSSTRHIEAEWVDFKNGVALFLNGSAEAANPEMVVAIKMTPGMYIHEVESVDSPSPWSSGGKRAPKIGTTTRTWR